MKYPFIMLEIPPQSLPKAYWINSYNHLRFLVEDNESFIELSTNPITQQINEKELIEFLVKDLSTYVIFESGKSAIEFINNRQSIYQEFKAQKALKNLIEDSYFLVFGE